jgi:cytochrome c
VLLTVLLKRSCVAALLGWCALAPLAQAAQVQGSAVAGKALYAAKCSACHSVSDNRAGPQHAGIVGRKAGSVKDYDYSDALRASKLVWTQANLNRWLTDPEAVIPGQRMGYRLGVAQERADVVAYLATLKQL